MNVVGKNIKKIRLSHGMTQEELAEKMFVTRQTISNWENGKSQLDIETLSSLAEIYGVEVTELIYGRKDPYQKFQKKYILIAVISLCVIVAVIVLERTLYPHLVEQLRMYFTGSFELAVYDFSVKPIGFFALGVFVLSVLSFWVDTRLEKRVRIVFLIVGIMLFLLSFWMLVEMILIYKAPQIFPGFILFSPVYRSIFLRMIFLLAMPLFSGSALFLGMNKRP